MSAAGPSDSGVRGQAPPSLDDLGAVGTCTERSAAWRAGTGAGRPLVLAGVHPAHSPAEVVLAASAVAERSGARLVVALAAPAERVTPWLPAASMHTPPVVHLHEQCLQRQRALVEWDAAALLSLTDLPWAVVRLRSTGSTSALRTLARQLGPTSVVLPRAGRYSPGGWPARAARALRSAPADLLLCR